MYILNKEDFQSLNKDEIYFTQCIEYEFLRLLDPTSVGRVSKIYEKYSGNGAPIQNGCGTCNINMYKLVGNWYFTTKKIILENDKEVEEEVKENSKIKKRK